MVALRKSAIIAAGDAPYQRGVPFLVDSQLEDGSWLAHGYDQFISATVTNWAVMALLLAAAADR